MCMRSAATELYVPLRADGWVTGATSSHANARVCQSIVLLLREAAICLPLARRGRSAAKDRLSGVVERGMED
ncbi:hypothetical protein VZT92_006204 [Zoarces viviparus]